MIHVTLRCDNCGRAETLDVSQSKHGARPDKVGPAIKSLKDKGWTYGRGDDKQDLCDYCQTEHDLPTRLPGFVIGPGLRVGPDGVEGQPEIPLK